MGHGARQRPIVFSTHTPGVLTWPPPSDSQAPTFWWLTQNAIASHSTFTAMLQAPPLGRWLVLVGNGTGHRAPFRPPCPPISLLAVALIGLHCPSLRGGLHSPRLMAGFWLAMGQSTGPHFALPAPPHVPPRGRSYRDASLLPPRRPPFAPRGWCHPRRARVCPLVAHSPLLHPTPPPPPPRGWLDRPALLLPPRLTAASCRRPPRGSAAMPVGRPSRVSLGCVVVGHD